MNQGMPKLEVAAYLLSLGRSLLLQQGGLGIYRLWTSVSSSLTASPGKKSCLLSKPSPGPAMAGSVLLLLRIHRASSVEQAVHPRSRVWEVGLLQKKDWEADNSAQSLARYHGSLSIPLSACTCVCMHTHTHDYMWTCLSPYVYIHRVCLEDDYKYPPNTMIQRH